MVCGRCGQEIFEEEPPARCRHCQKPYRGRVHYYYSLSFSSTELSTLPKELRVYYLRILGGTLKGFLGVLPQNLWVYPHRILGGTPPDSYPTRNNITRNNRQETSKQETTNSLVLLLFIFFLVLA